MVAVILLVASVTVISLLQGQSSEFDDVTHNATESSECTLAEGEYERAIDCSRGSDSPAVQDIRDQYSQCNWVANGRDIYCD
jgi:hypothetical protein